MEKRLRKKILTHMLYGFGASIVIIGALFKILHIEIGPLTGGLVLGIGLGTEALIFCVAALDTSEIKEEHENFVNSRGGSKGSSNEEGLSEKLDQMLAEAQLDVSLMEKFTESINYFQNTVESLSPVADAISTTNNYSEKITEATHNIDGLNEAYKKQVEVINDQIQTQSDRLEIAKSSTELDEDTFQKAENLKVQIDALSSNLDALNQVYAGMLSAMNKN